MYPIPKDILELHLRWGAKAYIRRLHLSQPAVTGHIRRLEANLETTLFIRSANGVSLTERGAHLRERVSRRLCRTRTDFAGAG